MHRFLLMSFCLILFSSRGFGQPPQEKGKSAPPETNASAESDPIEEALRQYVEAFNTNDAPALAARWAPQGVYSNQSTGERTAGRAALQSDFEELFAESPGVRLVGRLENVRLIKPDVAAADGQATVVYPDGDASETSFSAIFIKEGDAWLLESIRETDLHSPETAYDALAELEWMVGHWVDQTEAAQVDTVVRWSPNQAFLLRSFSVQLEGQESSQGTQVIGWDPLRKQIRSWTFHSDGSFGEGVWSRNDADWMVKSTQVLADGRLASATQVITRVDENTLTVQTLGRNVDGEPAPATDPVTVARVETPASENASPAEGASPAKPGASATPSPIRKTPAAAKSSPAGTPAKKPAAAPNRGE